MNSELCRHCDPLALHHPYVTANDIDVLHVQALATNELHKLYTKYAEAAGPQGLIRLCVAGDTRLICTGPEAFAALLRNKPFLPRPSSLYNVFFMFVRCLQLLPAGEAAVELCCAQRCVRSLLLCEAMSDRLAAVVRAAIRKIDLIAWNCSV